MMWEDILMHNRLVKQHFNSASHKYCDAELNLMKKISEPVLPIEARQQYW